MVSKLQQPESLYIHDLIHIQRVYFHNISEEKSKTEQITQEYCRFCTGTFDCIIFDDYDNVVYFKNVHVNLYHMLQHYTYNINILLNSLTTS